VRVFKYLLSLGADPSNKKTSVIDRAAISGGNIEIIAILSRFVAFSGCLHLAASSLRCDLFAWLLHNKSNESQIRSKLLHACASSGNTRLLIYCFDQKVDVNVKEKGETPLHTAIRTCRYTVVRLLLAHPLIKVNVKNPNSETPLMLAAVHGLTYVVQLLLKHADVDPNIKDKEGYTPLHRACDHNHVETLKALLRFPNIDINQRDSGSSFTYIDAPQSTWQRNADSPRS
jgi:ankyrin repeat protein